MRLTGLQYLSTRTDGAGGVGEHQGGAAVGDINVAFVVAGDDDQFHTDHFPADHFPAAHLASMRWKAGCMIMEASTQRQPN